MVVRTIHDFRSFSRLNAMFLTARRYDGTEECLSSWQYAPLFTLIALFFLPSIMIVRAIWFRRRFWSSSTGLSSRGWVWEPSYYEFYRSSFSDSCPHWLPAQLYVDVCNCSGFRALWFSYLTSQLFTRVDFVDDHHPVSILEALFQLHDHIPVLGSGIDNQTLAPALGSSFFLRQLLSSHVRNEHPISPS